MRSLFLFLLLPFTLDLAAQYGSFNAAAVKAARAHPLVVVLDDGDTPYNRAVMNAVKADWKFNGGHDFVKAGELAMQPVAAERTYLMKIVKTDPSKYDGTFLTLVQGWKQKKGEALEQKDGAFINIPVQNELAFILIDPKAVNEAGAAPRVHMYTKHLQDYLKLVENGKITDKTTADRIYSGRNRHIKETQLWLGKEHLDQTMTDMEKIKEAYPADAEIRPVDELMAAVEKQDQQITVTDVVITGDHKTKHSFRRVFNAGTGELMYMKDEAALHGKKEGFMDEDLKTIARSR